MHTRHVLPCALLLMACATDKTTAQGSATTPSGAQGDANAQWANREAVASALLDCARLTFASNETALTATVITDEDGRALALVVQDVDGQPQTLMCPMDRARVKDVLGGGNGRGWGRPPAVGWKLEAYCGASFDGVSGCGVTRERMQAGDLSPPVATAPAAPAATPKEVEALVAKNASRLESVVREPEDREFKLRRLGTDVLSKDVVNLEQQLSQLDLAVNLCLHGRQPNLPLHTSTDFVIRLEVSKGSRAMVAPFSVSGGQPENLYAFLRPCLTAMVGEEAAQGLSALVRYSAVAAITKTPPGRFVQQADVEILTDNVEVSAPANVRRELTARVAAALKLCMEKHPVESRAVLGRWSQVGAVRVTGEVETRFQDRLRLIQLTARDATNEREIKPVPAAVDPHVRCAFQDLAMDGNGTAAKVDWVFVMKAATLPR